MTAVRADELGRFGVWTFEFEGMPAARLRDTAQELEGLGWKAVWIPELLGRDAFTHAGFLLASTTTLHVVNGIAQIWAREARWAKGASGLLADAYPGRHIMGLGFGGEPRPGVKPLAAMAGYLDALDAPGDANPAPAVPVRRLLAAYGPGMLRLAGERAAGAHTYHVTWEHTERAREILGPDAFLGVEHAVLFETDPAAARAAAREHLRTYLATPYNIAKFRRLGYGDDDLSGGGSDRFVDDLVFWGGPEDIAAKLHGHIERGADHVGVQVLGTPPGQSPLPRWRQLAGLLL